jgi:hypothetical protein
MRTNTEPTGSPKVEPTWRTDIPTPPHPRDPAPYLATVDGSALSPERRAEFWAATHWGRRTVPLVLAVIHACNLGYDRDGSHFTLKEKV